MVLHYFLVLLVGGLLQGIQSQTCDGADTQITLHCSSCASGYLCTDTTDIVAFVTCNDGQACSVDEQLCIDASTEDTDNCGCTDGTNAVTGAFIDPFDSSSYVTCTNGVPSYTTCPEDTYVDLTIGECAEVPECPDGSMGSFPLENSCGQYITCDAIGEATVETCSDDQIFDYETQTCVDTFTCPILDSIYQEPLKCNIYHICINSNMNTFCCPYGENYNDVSKRCEPSSDSNCDRHNIIECLDVDYEMQYCGLCETSQEGDTFNTFLGNECQTAYYECTSNGTTSIPTLKYCDDGSVYVYSSQICEFETAHPEC